MKAYKVEIANQMKSSGSTQDDFYMIICRSFEEAGKIAQPLVIGGYIKSISYWGEVVGQAEYPIIKAKDRWA